MESCSKEFEIVFAVEKLTNTADLLLINARRIIRTDFFEIVIYFSANKQILYSREFLMLKTQNFLICLRDVAYQNNLRINASLKFKSRYCENLPTACY